MTSGESKFSMNFKLRAGALAGVGVGGSTQIMTNNEIYEHYLGLLRGNTEDMQTLRRSPGVRKALVRERLRIEEMLERYRPQA